MADTKLYEYTLPVYICDKQVTVAFVRDVIEKALANPEINSVEFKEPNFPVPQYTVTMISSCLSYYVMRRIWDEYCESVAAKYGIKYYDPGRKY